MSFYLTPKRFGAQHIIFGLEQKLGIAAQIEPGEDGVFDHFAVEPK